MAAELWTVKDVADYTGYNPGSIRRRAREGTIPCRKWGGRWAFDPEQITRWWEAGAPMNLDPKLFDSG